MQFVPTKDIRPLLRDTLGTAFRYVSGRTEMRDHLLRRAKLLPYLFKHREQFGDRIARLLSHGDRC